MTSPATGPWCVVVAGVSGAGKSTVAAALAAATGARLADGDAFHSSDAIRKMQDGQALSDADRAPWLAAIGTWIDAQHESGANSVISCSALRRTYRARLCEHRPWVRFCLLEAPAELLRRRLSEREGHFMPASQLPSQLALLEPLGPEENGTTLDASQPVEVLTAAALQLILGPH